MVYPFSTQRAKQLCLELQQNFDKYGAIDFESEGKYKTESLFNGLGGQMFGILVCRDSQNKEVVLKAFSGQFNEEVSIANWVEPPFDVQKYKKLLKEIYGVRDDKEKSKELHRQLNTLYEFYTVDRKSITFTDIFEQNNFPGGSGNCSTVKLISSAFKKGLTPISMAEFYYGLDSLDKKYIHKEFYPPCVTRCKKILSALLGLEIVYRDDYIVVVNKQPKLLSVPGRGLDKTDSVATRIKKLYPDCIEQPALHRLDYDTSGLMVLAFTKEAHRAISVEFINRGVEKRYIALLDGIIKEECGTIELAFRYDEENKPRQKYDPVLGKVGITHWQKIKVEPFNQKDRFVTRVEFNPLTGRTHQLRVHSAHPKGLNHPIVGDSLYGDGDSDSTLCLHASKLTFTHPITKEVLTFYSEPTF